MAPRLSGQTSIFGVSFVSKSHMGIEEQKKLEKFAILTRKPRSHAWILIYWTWPIGDVLRTLYKQQELRRFVDAIRSTHGNCSQHHWRPVFNVRIGHSLCTTDVLTSQMNLNILELSHFTLQTSIQHKKSKTKRQIIVRLF